MSQASAPNDDALSFDIHILAILLRRNRHQQHRCIYFRRLSMVLQSLKKECPSLETFNTWKNELMTLSKSLIRPRDESRILSKGRPKKEEHWMIERRGDTAKLIESPGSSNTETEKSEELLMMDLQATAKKFQHFAFESIPQISSRIMHAASAVFHELSRGNFVPFLTVAIACLGRIHCLLLRMGRETVDCFNECKIQYDGKMDHLIEISSQDLASKTSAFVEDIRWKDALRKLKIKLLPESNMPLNSTSNVSDELSSRNNFPVKDDAGDIGLSTLNNLGGYRDTFSESDTGAVVGGDEPKLNTGSARGKSTGGEVESATSFHDFNRVTNCALVSELKSNEQLKESSSKLKRSCDRKKGKEKEKKRSKKKSKSVIDDIFS